MTGMPARPNVLFLMTDQQRWDALGVNNPQVLTPHLDRLAARGVVYGQAVCQCPMCVPSRYSLTTGLYPSQVGVRNNTQAIHDDDDMPVPTLFERFQRAGYHTIGCGKTHWYVRPDTARGIRAPRLSRRGFDVRAMARQRGGYEIEPEAVCFSDAHPDEQAWLREYSRTTGHGGEGAAGYAGQTAPWRGEQMREHWLATQAIESIRAAHARCVAGDGAPWFCYVSLDAPHAPLLAPPEFEALYDVDSLEEPGGSADGMDDHFPALAHTREAYDVWAGKPPTERRRTLLRYYALCSYIDAMFGRVLTFLEETGALEQTVVVFLSDHGESLGERRRFGKYSLYEASVRVPLIMAGPGVARGQRDDRLAELVDVAPTLLALAGLDVPASLPGELLTAPSRRAGAFAEMHGNGSQDVLCAPALMWRTREWKLIVWHAGDMDSARANPRDLRGELYHLAGDPHEERNLYCDPAWRGVREEMTRDCLYAMALRQAVYPWHESHARPGSRE